MVHVLLQNERQLRENATDLEAIKQAHGVSMDEKTASCGRGEKEGRSALCRGAPPRRQK